MTPAPTSRPARLDPEALDVHPATEDRFDDVATLLAPRRADAPACWCLTYRLTSSENSALTAQQRPERLRQLCARDPRPWCPGLPRRETRRLVRRRTTRRDGTTRAVSHHPTGRRSARLERGLFVVGVGYRQRGVARALLAGAVEHARSSGVVAIEGYPVDTGGTRISGTLAYVGTTDLFAGAGFDRVLETAARSAGLRRWLMRRELP